ncbi:MAG: DNA polymerase I, partial [Bacteroidetes bacterium]|nr:DNA polymerase I [Bacteroidota bacterium]
MPEKKLFLLDAYALIYRAYFAFIRNPRYNSKGLNTSAIFGFVNTLDELMKAENPSHIAVVFDTAEPTFRHEQYPAYKANREAMPEDLRASIPYIRDIIEAFSIPIIEKPGFEADDVIGTLAKIAEKEGFDVFMMTPDKDYCQLVTEKIRILKPRKGVTDAEKWGTKEVLLKFGVERPEQVIDILGLMGDSSDNIPGAPGIGEKTAMKLIGQYKSIENLYAHINELKGKQKETLEENKAQVLLSKELVTICLNVPVDLNEKDVKIGRPDNPRLRKIFDELEFRTLAERIIPPETPVTKSPVLPGVPVQGSLFDDSHYQSTEQKSGFSDISSAKKNYLLINTSDKKEELVKQLQQQKAFCFDTETTGIDACTAELVGISFCFENNKAYYVPVDENYTVACKTIADFKDVLENPGIKKIGQNIKYDILMLKRYGVEVAGELFDTMIAHYLLQPELRHNLDYLSEMYLGYKPVPIEELIGKRGKNQQSMRSVPVEKVKDYAAEDADVTFQLKPILENELKKNNITDLYNDHEAPLIYVLADMEMTGVCLKVSELEASGKHLHVEAEHLEKEIYGIVGEEFNIASPKQLGDILFDKLKLDPKAKRTATKQYSTGEDVLLKLQGKHPVIDKVLEYRSVKKLLSTYIDALPRLLNPVTGRLHSSFNQARVATGRLSSDNPNLQNIPVREERGREIRRAFTASDSEHVFMSADYSQIELRIMAHLSEDPHMIEAFMKR